MYRLRQWMITLLSWHLMWRTALALSVLAILFLATTSLDVPAVASVNDKVNHMVAFVELTLLLRLGWPDLRAHLVVMPLLAFGVAIELIQSQLPYRDFSLADIAADCVGIGLGLLIWPYLYRLRNSDRT